jgi:hypothetical protein
MPHLPFGAKGDGVGQDILDILESRGVGAAFGLWLTDPKAHDPLDQSGSEVIEGVEELLEHALKPSSTDLEDYLNSILHAA